jgi:hypothetical protein
MVDRRSLSLAVVLVCAVLGLVIGATAVVLGVDAPSQAPPDLTPARADAPTETRAVRVLHAWDVRRSTAFARGDDAALAALYAPGSRTGATDRQVLAGYRERGLRVTGMTTQVLSAVVLRDGADLIEVRVTDVLVDAVVTDLDGVRWALPRDRPSTRRVVLVRRDGLWLVAEAYPVD